MDRSKSKFISKIFAQETHTKFHLLCWVVADLIYPAFLFNDRQMFTHRHEFKIFFRTYKSLKRFYRLKSRGRSVRRLRCCLYICIFKCRKILVLETNLTSLSKCHENDTGILNQSKFLNDDRK